MLFNSRTLLLASLLLAPLLLSVASVHAQTPRGEQGLPVITNYTPRDYNANTQNWSIAQDRRGIIYVGNNAGLLEFDGATWKTITLPNRSTVRSVVLGEDGNMYVGGVRELGVLEANDQGETVYRSLLSDIPEEFRDFQDVWTALAGDGGIYFMTEGYIFRWSEGNVRAWPASNAFHQMSLANGHLYVREWGLGLKRLEEDEFVLIPGGEQFADERIYVILPYDDFRILLVTRTQGLFFFDGERLERFEAEATTFFNANPTYTPGSILRNGHFAIPTTSAGVAIMDRQGNLVDVIDKSSGLQDQAVLFTFLDARGDLWLGLNQGISRIEFGSPFRVLDERSGVESLFLTVARFEGELFGITSTGLYRLNRQSGSWEAVPGLSSLSFDLEVLPGRLLVAAGLLGVHEYRSGRLSAVRTAVDNSYSASIVQRSSRDTNRVWVGLFGALGSLKLAADGSWIDEGIHPNLDRSPAYIVEESNGNLWLGMSDHGAYHVTFEDPDNPDWTAANLDYYGPEKGLTDFSSILFEFEDEIFVSDDRGHFRYDAENDAFLPDDRLSDLRGSDGASIAKDDRGRTWITLGRNIGILTSRPDGGFDINTTELSRLSNDQPSDIVIDGHTAWIPTLDGVVRYDTRYEGSQNAGFPTVIRAVTVGSDSVIYAGREVPSAGETQLTFKHNSITFRFANPSYQSAEQNNYQTYLEGFDEEWSDWTRETRRPYTNLAPGSYTFRVRSRDVVGHVAGEASYVFEVLPPWYRTWFAYGLYVILFIASVFAVDRLQRRRLTKKADEQMRLQESQLRAEAAEANTKTAEAEAKALHAENERHKNIELLTEIGRNITATLSIKGIIDTVYENVNAMMDASVFAIGIHNAEGNRLDFPGTREKGESLAPYFNDLADENRLAPICFMKNQEIVINDWSSEHANYIKEWTTPVAGEDPASIIYLPLRSKEKVIGVLSAQSFEKGAYTAYHVNILRNLATYAAIALDNADAYDKLNATVETLNKTLKDLKTTQEQLVTQEKMASLGQLTAGIAHEIKNPLNFVNNFAELNAELAKDLSSELSLNLDKRVGDVYEELNEMLSSLKINALQIAKHGKRADSIVKNMMQHASGGSTERFRVEVNAFLDEYVGLAYHGMRAQTPELNITIVKDYDDAAGNAEMAPQELGRVFLNLMNNAIYAAHERARNEGTDFEPTVSVSTRRLDSQLEIKVSDNGGGIPEANREKIFEPLFTTKPTGSGTGLGLSLSFDIVTSGHGGTLTVESEVGKGSTFTVLLPV